MKRFLLFILFVLPFVSLYAQADNNSDFEETPSSITEVIQQLGLDTVVFYYDDKWNLVKPVCAITFRISRIDTIDFNFTGKFVDYYMYDSTVAVEGAYSGGKKEGQFNIYYSNGQIEQSGHYANNKKTGIWEYYYEDGTKRQVLDFKEDEILILEFWNEKGKKLVDAGNGEWYDYDSPEKFRKTTGEVLNGHRNGTWKNTLPSRNITINVEKYKEGKLVSGKISSAAFGTQNYKDTTYCTIERPHDFLRAEQFQVSRCYKTEKFKQEPAMYPGGMDAFFKQVREKFTYSAPILKRGVIQVAFTIDADGKMINFRPISALGYEFELIRVLQTMYHWTPAKVNGKPTTQPRMVSFEIR